MLVWIVCFCLGCKVCFLCWFIADFEFWFACWVLLLFAFICDLIVRIGMVYGACNLH